MLWADTVILMTGWHKAKSDTHCVSIRASAESVLWSLDLLRPQVYTHSPSLYDHRPHRNESCFPLSSISPPIQSEIESVLSVCELVVWGLTQRRSSLGQMSLGHGPEKPCKPHSQHCGPMGALFLNWTSPDVFLGTESSTGSETSLNPEKMSNGSWSGHGENQFVSVGKKTSAQSTRLDSGKQTPTMNCELFGWKKRTRRQKEGVRRCCGLGDGLHI